MSFKVDHEYEGLQVKPETFMMPSMLQGLITKSSQWEPVVINLIDEIDSETATVIAAQLRKAEDTGQSFVPFYIDSPGGSVYGLLSIVEAMRRCKIPIYTFTSGLAASCAACVFCLGKRRFMTKYSRLLLHDVSIDFSNETSITSSNIKVEANEMRVLNKTILHIIAENTGHPTRYFVDLIKNKRNNDIYVNAKQALEWKLATDIGFPVVKVTHTTTMDVVMMSESAADVNAAPVAKDSDDDKDSDDEYANDDASPKENMNVGCDVGCEPQYDDDDVQDVEKEEVEQPKLKKSKKHKKKKLRQADD